jgi:site-specific recombinase
MFGKKKRNKPGFIETVSAQSDVLPITDSKQGLDFLVAFFSTIRPASAKGRRDAAANLSIVIAALHQSPVLLANLRHAVLSQLIRTDLSSALTESGIPLARGFWQEFFGRLRHKLLPPLQRENDFLYVMDRVFFRNHDFIWVEGISRELWVQFFETVGLSLKVGDDRITLQLLHSLKTLTFQVAQLGLEKEVLQYIEPEHREDNPFVEQSYLMRELEEWLLREGRDGEVGHVHPLLELSARIGLALERCSHCLDHIRQNQSQRGASLHQTYILMILANRLDRMSILVDLLDGDHQVVEPVGGMVAAKGHVLQDTGKFVDFFRMLVRNENRKNSMIEFLSQSMGYLAYQIAEHKGVKGNKYITSTWPEYRSMLYSAMGGGAWVCLVVLIKNLLIRTPMAIFWHGFAYSVNYSLGFILIEETHTTLATKQPAFTASAVASSLDTRKNTHRPNLYNLAITVAKVSRSQIASFAGNLIVVFPGVWVLAWAYEKIVGSKLVEGQAAAQMLKDQHPWQSASLLYACNTGFFLFLSGIIAGYVQNKLRYSHVSERLQTHPLLRLSLSAERLRRLANHMEKNAGPIAGSIALGFFLGMSSIVVHVFGIPFDIRHITISAGNTSLAVYGLGFDHVRPWYLVQVILGVLGIGVLNFLVSFSLAFFVAVKSRGVHLRDYPEFLGILYRYFKSNPLDFIRPRRRVVEEKDGAAVLAVGEGAE